MKDRDSTQDDQQATERWMKDNDIPLPLCWGKEGTCLNVGTTFILGLEGIFCVDCYNATARN